MIFWLAIAVLALGANFTLLALHVAGTPTESDHLEACECAVHEPRRTIERKRLKASISNSESGNKKKRNTVFSWGKLILSGTFRLISWICDAVDEEDEESYKGHRKLRKGKKKK